MRCRACDKQIEGGSELCGPCNTISNYTAAELREEKAKPVRQPDPEQFQAFVEKHNLENSWRDGLGLMDPEKRAAMLRAKLWDGYCDWLSLGFTHQASLYRASGLSKRGSQHSGTEFGHSQDTFAPARHILEQYQNEATP